MHSDVRLLEEVWEEEEGAHQMLEAVHIRAQMLEIGRVLGSPVQVLSSSRRSHIQDSTPTWDYTRARRLPFPSKFNTTTTTPSFAPGNLCFSNLMLYFLTEEKQSQFHFHRANYQYPLEIESQ